MTDAEDIEAMARAVYCNDQPSIEWEHRDGSWHDSYIGAMRTALSTLKQRGWQRVPEGYVVVPVEPTDDMIIAGIIERQSADVPEAWKLATIDIYRAMIAAVKE